jgi:hypothetical protein
MIMGNCESLRPDHFFETALSKITEGIFLCGCCVYGVHRAVRTHPFEKLDLSLCLFDGFCEIDDEDELFRSSNPLRAEGVRCGRGLGRISMAWHGMGRGKGLELNASSEVCGEGSIRKRPKKMSCTK